MKKIQLFTFTLLLISSLILSTRIATAQLKATLEGHTDKVWSVAFSPNGKMLASGSWDRTVRLWNVNTGELLYILTGHTNDVMSVAFSPDGQTLASGSWDNTIRLWNPRTGKLIRTLSGHAGAVASVAFSPDGQILASGNGDQTIRLWNTTTWNVERTLTGHRHIVDAVAFSSDGEILASGSRDTTLRLWNPRNGQHIKTLSGHTSDVLRLMFSPDDTTLASRSLDDTVRLWNPRNGKLKATLTGQRGGKKSVAFSPDGAMLLIGGRGISVWDTQKGEYGKSLTGDIGSTLSIALSPDGQILASGSDNNTVGLWDLSRYVPDVPFADVAFDSMNIPQPIPPPAAVRDYFQLDPLFYQQWINVEGFPVLASSNVSPYAVKEAAWVIYNITRHRPDVLQTMAKATVRFSIIGHNERTSDIPEHRRNFPEPHFYYDIRSRGAYCPLCLTVSAPEESILDQYSYSVVLHEFAHAFHEAGLNTTDPTFEDRLIRTYDRAIARGLWKNTYASTSMSEYWAQGVGTWFNANPTYKAATTRRDMKNYDPRLAALLAEIFGDGAWRYTVPSDQLHLPHLRGFNPLDAPRLKLPPILLETYRQFTFAPDIDGDGKWVNLKAYAPSELPRLKKSRVIEESISVYFMNHTGKTVSVYEVEADGEEVFQRNVIPLNFVEFGMRIGSIHLVKDNTGKNIAVFFVDPKTRGYIVRAFVGNPPPIEQVVEQPTSLVRVASAKRPPMYWVNTDKGTLHRLVGAEVENLAPSVRNATHLAIDAVNEKLYWTEQIGKNQGRVISANLDGSNIKVLANIKSGVPGSIAIDPMRRKLYWTNSRGRIQRSNLNGKQIKSIIKNLQAPDKMIVDAARGKLYWTENTTDIRRSNLNGEGVENIATELSRIADIAILGNKLYWAESTGENRGSIRRANLNGSNATTLLRLPSAAMSIAIDAAGRKLYWTDGAGNIQRSNLNGKRIQKVVLGLTAPIDLAVGNFNTGRAGGAPTHLSTSRTPDTTSLLANYPNPFNPETWIPYQLAEPSDVNISIYNVRGVVVRALALGHQPGGTYTRRSRAAYWDGRNMMGEPVASGVYFYTLTAGDFRATRKMVIRK